jgi:hypothetical protein
MTHPLRRVSDFCPDPRCGLPWDRCQCVCPVCGDSPCTCREYEEASDTSDETEPFLPEDAA